MKNLEKKNKFRKKEKDWKENKVRKNEKIGRKIKKKLEDK